MIPKGDGESPIKGREIGQMASKDNIVKMLNEYAIRSKSCVIDLEQFVLYARKQAEEKKGQADTVDPILLSPVAVSSFLEDCEKEGQMKLVRSEGRIQTVLYAPYAVSAVKRFYDALEVDTEKPFPNEENTGFVIPPDIAQSMDVKQDLFGRIGRKSERDEVYRLTFSDGIADMWVTSSLIAGDMADRCISKIRNYVNTQKNAEYMKRRLALVFKQRERSIQEMMNNIIGNKQVALATITNPDDFSSQFWTHFLSYIIQDFKNKTSKLSREHSFCQAAYILGFYNLYYKKRRDMAKETEAALKEVGANIRKPPYFFTLSDIDNFADSHGMPLSRKYQKERLYKFLEEKTKAQSQQELPEVFRLKTQGNKEYYIAKESYLTLMVKKVHDAAFEYRKHYIEEWSGSLDSFTKTQAMTDDKAFAKEVNDHIREEDPLLHAMLRPEILYLTLRDVKPGPEVTKEIERLFDKTGKELIPANEILFLDRKNLLSEAKNLIPLWKTIPLFTAIVLFFKRLGGKKAESRDKAESGEDSRQDTQGKESGSKVLGGEKALAIEYRKAVYALKVQFAGKDKPIDTALAELAEKWNPLYDPQAKENLVEDVNSLIRDYIRKIRRSIAFRAPDADRITNLATQLVGHENLTKIKKKDILVKYIELYIIRILSQR
jgi:hypothetical protein